MFVFQYFPLYFQEIFYKRRHVRLQHDTYKNLFANPVNEQQKLWIKRAMWNYYCPIRSIVFSVAKRTRNANIFFLLCSHTSDNLKRPCFSFNTCIHTTFEDSIQKIMIKIVNSIIRKSKEIHLKCLNDITFINNKQTLDDFIVSQTGYGHQIVKKKVFPS